MRFSPAIVSFALALFAAASADAEPLDVGVDFARSAGEIRALHGINKGPLAAGGMLDLTAPLRALGIPSMRLHDCHWPNPDVVDMHAVFPRAEADPAAEASYDFALTDEYLAAVQATGAQIVYRLGESIEHTKTKRFVHPPRDPERWAEACVGIVRHCNEGWAGGTRLGIRYWEIWNEPENRPAMWSGTDEDYFRLYAATARALKTRWPALKIGGPAVGASGEFAGGEFRPTAFVTGFLDFCRRENLPLDFFSWHCYTDSPTELTTRARAIRQLLDARGFTGTESHLNEWNYLPGKSWKPLGKKAEPAERARFYEEMGGEKGAAFLVAALAELQDAPVDVANLFHGETGGFGLFNEHGVPLKAYAALRSFRRLLDTPRRVACTGAVPGQLAVLAGINAERNAAVVLISNLAHPAAELRLGCANLPWTGPTNAQLYRLDRTHDGAETRERHDLSRESPVFALPAGSVLCLVLRPAAEP